MIKRVVRLTARDIWLRLHTHPSGMMTSNPMLLVEKESSLYVQKTVLTIRPTIRRLIVAKQKYVPNNEYVIKYLNIRRAFYTIYIVSFLNVQKNQTTNSVPL